MEIGITAMEAPAVGALESGGNSSPNVARPIDTVYLSWLVMTSKGQME